MKLLLDTHALYWFVEGDPQLSEVALNSISHPDNEIYVSPASYWEIAIKISIGKWRLHQPYADFLDIVFQQYEFQMLPIAPRHTIKLISLPFHHRDPFDRLLISQSLAEGIPIVTIDEKFDGYDIQRIS